MKKRTLAMVLSTAMVAAMMTGCSSNSKETEKATEKAAVTEAVTEKTTEKATEKATEKETEKATEKETEAKTEAASETEAESETASEASESESEAVSEATATEETETETETEEATEATETETETETEEVTEAAETETETETEEVTEAAETETETETEEVTEAAETETETETEEATEAAETETETETEEATEAATEKETDAKKDAALADGEYTIGISQFAEHGSLDNCREGFLAGLAEEGFVEGENLTVKYDNAQADTGNASTIADAYVSDGVDLICAIATPSAMSAYNSAMKADIPVVYTAISDPVGAGLANEDGTSVGNITGTSDKLPVEEQLKMIREMMPEAKKIGIIYTTSEANSVSTIKEYKEIAPKYGFEIVETGINTIADVDMAAAEMVEKVDCISNLTDNTVVSALQTVLSYANDAKIPVFGSEVEQVKSGCLASMGIDYVELGKQTGEMAAAILRGEETASEMNFELCQGASLYVNTEEADKLGIELDANLVKDAAEVFDTITVE